MILNLKNLNQYASKTHFRMDTLKTVITFIEKDCYMVSIDLNQGCLLFCVDKICGQEIFPFHVEGYTFSVHLPA